MSLIKVKLKQEPRLDLRGSLTELKVTLNCIGYHVGGSAGLGLERTAEQLSLEEFSEAMIMSFWTAEFEDC